MQLRFYKHTDGRWYVDLPNWEGDFEDLEMVAGADDLLEVLSHQLKTQSITFEVWTKMPNVPCGLMTKIDQTRDGATYQVSNCMYYDSTAWLCNVTKFVFDGIHPNHIYFRVVNEDSVLPTGLTDDESEEHEGNDSDAGIGYKKLKVTAVSLELKKAVTVTVDMKAMAKCKTQDAVKKAIEKQILETKVFRQDDLSKLKYQGRKDVLDEWKVVHAVYEEEVEDKARELSNSGRVTPDNIVTLRSNEIFVFGSNALGQHGGGAARYAYEHFGAVMGEGHGLHGKSYAIDSMSGLAVMEAEVKAFAEYAKSHSSLKFLVTPIGCGIAGFNVKQIAPMFECCRNISNVSLPASFWDIIGMPEQITVQSKYDLQRFLAAQERDYPEALEEIQNGRKTGHWIWYIFPQQKGLGHSYNSEYYGLDGLDEAKAYLRHPVLGQRLREICQALLGNKGKSIGYIMGSDIDVLKLKTSMELFDLASPNDIFDKVLTTFF